ncbi:MAG: HAD family phosphatase [Spirochaetaceae bacterium]|jgi:HAD superfamily hydrolase (TIGR01509 family)|nr:HAD family phosphatase [Spirochaetaceae bacterium]
MISDTFTPAAVIFDMDGLMLDTERPMVAMWRRVGWDHGWDITQDLLFRTVGVKEEVSRGIFLEEYGADFPYDALKREVFRRREAQIQREGIPHRPGLGTLLDHLAARGIPLGLASSTVREIGLWKLRKARILDRFQVLAFGDEVRLSKPAPDIFLLAASRLHKAPEDCLGFEDSPAGLQGLAAAGIRSVFIRDLIEPSPEILSGVWCRFEDLAEAVTLF